MELVNLSLTSIKLCSPVVIFMIYVIVSGVSLFMSRNTLKRFNNQKMENLYNLHSWSEVKLIIVLGVIIYGLCQYDQMNLAWIFLILPVIYLMLKNLFVYYNVSVAHQNAPKDSEPFDLLKKVSETPPTPGSSILPAPPVVKKEVDTTIFGMRGDPVVEGNTNTPPQNQSPTSPAINGYTNQENPPGGPGQNSSPIENFFVGGGPSTDGMSNIGGAPITDFGTSLF